MYKFKAALVPNSLIQRLIESVAARRRRIIKHKVGRWPTCVLERGGRGEQWTATRLSNTFVKLIMQQAPHESAEFKFAGDSSAAERTNPPIKRVPFLCVWRDASERRNCICGADCDWNRFMAQPGCERRSRARLNLREAHASTECTLEPSLVCEILFHCTPAH